MLNLERGDDLAIGDKIKKIRIKREMTQKELGLAIGFNKRSGNYKNSTGFKG